MGDREAGAEWGDTTEDRDLSPICFVLHPERVSRTAIPRALRERLAKITISSQLKLGWPSVKSRDTNQAIL